MTKSVVSFDDFLGVTDTPPLRANLYGVSGHPRLGRAQFVTTSRVERFDYDDAGEVREVETRNTIYRRSE